MPTIGKPTTALQKRLNQVRMRKNDPTLSKKEKFSLTKGEVLNKIAGSAPETKVKDIKNPNELGKNEFLKLLAFQLQNQDPMNPMDQEKFGAELAQFSQLEQLANLNAKFENMDQGKNLQEKFYAASMLGKKVISSGSSIKHKGAGHSTEMRFNLDQKAKNVLVRVLDSQGNIIAEKWEENLGRGSHEVPWNGRTLDNTYAPKGEYSIRVMAWDDMNQRLPVSTQSSGIVKSVTIVDGEPVLDVDGRKVALRDVKSFHVAHSNIEGDNNQHEGEVLEKPSALSPHRKKTIDAYEKQQSIYD